MIELKTQEELEIMREAGRITAMTLDMVEENIEAGLTTGQLDMLVEDFIRSHGAIPAFKNYQ